MGQVSLPRAEENPGFGEPASCQKSGLDCKASQRRAITLQAARILWTTVEYLAMRYSGAIL